ncbi:MAG: hypothetical protein KTR14_03340 [Vampirovibrio sp.]|nr:hypothetical protein [Vampirovibrio sp.]
MKTFFNLLNPVSTRGLTLMLTVALWVGYSMPVGALVRMDKESIDMAIKYGLKNQGMGYSSLLGPNWQEGTDGALLNIYTPFMRLAAAAARIGGPEKPSPQELKDLKKKRGIYLITRDFNNDKVIPKVKYSVSLYGDAPGFAKKYRARIQGIGRGKTFNLRPLKSNKPIKADAVEGEKDLYDAVLSFYFPFKTIEHLSEYQLILEHDEKEPVVFRIRNNKIY